MNKEWCPFCLKKKLNVLKNGIRDCSSCYNRFKKKEVNCYIYLFIDLRGCGKKIWVAEHRFVAENVLGRFLEKRESIHHKDLNKKNNHKNNLMVFGTNREHIKFHQKLKRFGLTKEILKEIEEKSICH